jgi:hypothetical protein
LLIEDPSNFDYYSDKEESKGVMEIPEKRLQFGLNWD